MGTSFNFSGIYRILPSSPAYSLLIKQACRGKGGTTIGKLKQVKFTLEKSQANGEESYAVPDWETLDLPKPALKRFRLKSLHRLKNTFNWCEEYFNERRCENLDMVATYRPYHFNGFEFGLYLYARYFTAFFLNILETTGLPLAETHKFSLEMVLAHGGFHYLVERYAEICSHSCPEPDLTLHLLHYPRYKREVYSPSWGTEQCYEETLANAYLFQNHPDWDKQRLDYLRPFYARQRGGYAQAAELEAYSLSSLYSQLENQIGRQGALSLEQWVRQNTPFSAEQLPVYLVNDGLEDAEFEKILEVLFPACLELEHQE